MSNKESVFDLPVILARTAHSCFSWYNLKCIGALLEALLDSVLPLSSLIFFRIQATDAGTNVRITSTTSLKATAIEL